MYMLSQEHYLDPTAGEAVARVAEVPCVRLNKGYPMVYICSPFAGDVERNIRLARRYSRFAVNVHCLPVTPHLLYPQFMNDQLPGDRKKAMAFCKILLAHCRQLWVFGGRISAGMALEIDYARRRGIPIRYFSSNCEEVYPYD